MVHYLVVRVLSIAVSIVIATMIVFLIMHAIPGGPFDAEKAPLTAVQQANIMRLYGLDKPLPVQYLNFLWGALRFQFGYPYQSPGETMGEFLSRTWTISAAIGGAGLCLGVLAGLALGIAAAVYRNTWIDYIATTISLFSITMPSYIISLGLVFIFALLLHWFPPSGWNGPNTWVLPILAYAAIPVGGVARYTRASMLDMAGRAYVAVARAKGLPRWRVTTRHVLRNSWRPIITVTLPLIPGIMTGSIFVESVFNVPGLGLFFVSSITKRDYPLELTLIYLLALMIGATYLITDILYVVLDPRVRLEGRPSR
jgi:ABC-type dipeptide/oligopeptide/nickel transport system permease component